LLSQEFNVIQFLDVAEQLFIEFGYEKTTTKAIAARATILA